MRNQLFGWDAEAVLKHGANCYIYIANSLLNASERVFSTGFYTCPVENRGFCA